MHKSSIIRTKVVRGDWALLVEVFRSRDNKRSGCYSHEVVVILLFFYSRCIYRTASDMYTMVHKNVTDCVK